MNEPSLLVHVELREDGTIAVRSPRVGWWSGHPQAGAILGSGSRVGTLHQLNRRFVLVMPESSAGRIAGLPPQDCSLPVEYGQVLCLLAPVRAGEAGEPQAAAGPGLASHADLPPGTWAVVSPTDGVFYRRSSPDAQPFVESGSRVRTGQPLGLVEVMKTFNPILYGGTGLPDEAEVIEIRCGEAADVRAGQILMVVR